LAHIQATFRNFAAKLPPDGPLAWNGDDPASRETFAGLSQPNDTFGFAADANLRAENHQMKDGIQSFDAVWSDGLAWRGLRLPVPGDFNVLNALAALGAARAQGATEAGAREGLAGFTGIWRRFERVGTRDGAPVISDYAHTPDAIEATLTAARGAFPGKRLIVAFQPHHHDRTRKLFDAFVSSFDEADTLILAEIYGVEGRKESEGSISSRALVEAIKARGKTKTAHYAADPADALRQLEALDVTDGILIIMGAGDLYSIAYPLCR